jgi:NitT/TauT family transport system substrate-binding protein
MGTKAEYLGAMLLADALGEFEKENLDIEWVDLPSTEAIPALAQGKTDVAAVGLNATTFNAVNAGSDIRVVFPGATKVPADGLYVALDPATGEPKEVNTIAAISGPAGISIVPITRYLESVGKTVDQVAFEKVQLADMPAALDAGAVDAAWVNAPVTTLLEETGRYARVGGYEDGEYGAGYLFGPNLLRDRPEVGQAFVRALARTAKEQLSGDYKQDQGVVEALATALESTPEDVVSTPALTFGAELPTDAIQSAQTAWVAIGDILESAEPLAPEKYLDATFLDRALTGS